MGKGKRSVDFFADTSKYTDLMFKIIGVPVLGTLLKRMMDANGTMFTYIPVYEGVEPTGGTALPISIAEHFINEASHHVLLDYPPGEAEPKEAHPERARHRALPCAHLEP